MRHIDSTYEAMSLAEEILSKRLKPLILISTTNEGTFRFDPEFVAREVAGDADVITMKTGEATYALESALPAKLHVFAGAARSYPTDFGAAADWRRSILRLPDRHTVEDLIEDALAQVTLNTVTASTTLREWVRATVERVSGASGNIAKLDNGERAMIVADNLPANLSLAEALVEGGPVEGWLTDRDLAPEPGEVDFARFEDGTVTLARVVKTTAQRAYLVLHPATENIVLRRRDVVPGADNEADMTVLVSELVSVGQTLRVRVTWAGETVGLSLVEVDENAPLVTPLSLLRGGAPWLREGVDAELPVLSPNSQTLSGDEAGTDGQQASLSIDVGSTEEISVPPETESAIPSTALIELRDEIRELRGAFGRLGRELRAGTDLETLDSLRDESAGLSAELHRERALRREQIVTNSTLRQELREAQTTRSESSNGKRTSRESWPSEEEWLGHEILTTWAARTIASEKSRYPLKDYAIGPNFVQSLDHLDEGQLEKTFRTVVDVAIGRIAEIPGRKLHRLRDGQGARDPYVVRADGAFCWRAAIEVNAPSARRLHYWQLPGGMIELSRVVLHDDVEP